MGNSLIKKLPFLPYNSFTDDMIFKLISNNYPENATKITLSFTVPEFVKIIFYG